LRGASNWPYGKAIKRNEGKPNAKVAVARITGDPVFLKKNYVDRAIERAVTSPEEFARLIVRDRKTAERIVKEAGVQPE
jgi:spore coat polysaccharide biosynthesis protein SpsF (cytidylyltransferase family)